MQRSLPMFPLSIVIIQGELVNLHIFEPRYKALIKKCFDDKSTFGIPVLNDKKLRDTGAEMQILKISNIYENGEMDIVCKAISCFRIIQLETALDSRNVSSAIVETLNFTENEDKEMNVRMHDLLHEFYLLAGVEMNQHFKLPHDVSEIYHKCGLSFHQELELFDLNSTKARQQYLIEHFKKLIPVLSELQKMKKLIQLNGHFKSLPQSF